MDPMEAESDVTPWERLRTQPVSWEMAAAVQSLSCGTTSHTTLAFHLSQTMEIAMWRDGPWSSKAALRYVKLQSPEIWNFSSFVGALKKANEWMEDGSKLFVSLRITKNH